MRTAGRRAKLSEIWDSEGRCHITGMCGTFDLLVSFKVILVSFGALVSKWPLSQKRLTVDRNGVNVGTRG